MVQTAVKRPAISAPVSSRIGSNGWIINYCHFNYFVLLSCPL